MSFDTARVRAYLNDFDFRNLFVEELGWSQPIDLKGAKIEVGAMALERTEIAQLAGVVVYELTAGDGVIPDAKVRKIVQAHISKTHHENLLIFLDRDRTQSLWYWTKREGGKTYPREHTFIRGQPADLFLQKLSGMVVDISELDERGNIPVTEVARKLEASLDVERVTKKFYIEFYDQHLAFIEHIKGIKDDHDRRWYASVLLNRLMLVYFLQSKGFIKGHSTNADYRYLQDELTASRERGKDLYYNEFLAALFFEGFAKAEEDRSDTAKGVVGVVPYLNGGLFLKHGIELRWPDIRIADKAFDNLFCLFESYSWNLDDTPGGKADEINPDVLGYIFEKYINQKAFGAYYTRTEITQYLCEQTIYKLILDRVNGDRGAKGSHVAKFSRRFDSMSDLLLSLDDAICRFLLDDVLPQLKLLDPACGSGAFLVAAMKTLINVYSAIIGKIEFSGDPDLKHGLDELRKEHHGSLNYYIKREIITNNLFGVDLMEDATEIAKLRLFLALVASAKTVDQLEPLPNIDFNIIAGNSLIGILTVNAANFDQLQKGEQGSLLGEIVASTYTQILKDKNASVELYKRHALLPENQFGHLDQDERLLQLREHIDKLRHDSHMKLNQLLLGDFQDLGIKYEEATWDEKKKKEGKTEKRPVEIRDIVALRPFHWGFEFDEVINQNGGFDAILTNPPWEIFKPNSKEFFQEFSDLVTKKKMSIHEFEKAQTKLLRDPEVREAWLEYLGSYPHVNAYFRSASQYQNQVSFVNGKKIGSDMNLYKLFTEQCFNLLRKGGYCGIVIPSGIYTDLGAKQLREMLFAETTVTGLFCFENRKQIFEAVDSRYKFLVLTYEKGGQTTVFPAAFMRHDVRELQGFPHEGAVNISIELIHRLSPDSLSVIEFRDDLDVRIAKDSLEFPSLNGAPGGWEFEIYGEELHMNRSAHLFKRQPTKYPLYEGRMIWHFDHRFERPQYWIDENDLREVFLDKRVKRITDLTEKPKDIRNDYETYRIAIRKIASNTNERTLIAAVIPPDCFAGNSLSVHFPFCHDRLRYNELRYDFSELMNLVSFLNSFVVDYFLRERMTTNLNSFYLYQLPIVRLSKKDKRFTGIATRAARLICTTSEFDPLAKEVGLKSHEEGATDPVDRGRLRAELDGIIAHIYRLSEEEFAHILKTFPLVPEPVRVAAQNAFRDIDRGLIE